MDNDRMRFVLLFYHLPRGQTKRGVSCALSRCRRYAVGNSKRARRQTAPKITHENRHEGRRWCHYCSHLIAPWRDTQVHSIHSIMGEEPRYP